MTTDQMRDIARRVLAGGDDTWAWRAALVAIRDDVEYGAMPAMLCAPCFTSALGVVNMQATQPAIAQPVGE